MVAAAEQEHAGDIDNETEHRDRDRFLESDRYRRDKAGDCFVANEERDHRKHDYASWGSPGLLR